MHPSRDIFTFRHFSLSHANATMKVGTDAMILGAWAPVAKNSARLLDVGTGSGVLALMLAQRSNARITAIDIDAESIKEAKVNFSNSLWAERLEAKQIALQEFSEKENEKFDCIISNPPFFQNSLLPGNDRYKFAKHTTSLTFGDFFSCSSRLLAGHGNLVVIIPFIDRQQIFNIAAKHQLYPKQTLTVFPTENKAPHRIIVSFYQESQSKVHSSEITVRKANDEYTGQYKQLTRDFHAEGYL
jgi:tRNA1Val (adenine37-N6)-methyltransferase